MTIKAIETVYNGHPFRSRLEARWAVFFYTLGIKYEYEYEGCDLTNSLRYLPDFYIPHAQTWIEIKSNHRPLKEIEIKKAHGLCKDSGENVIIISGNPWPNEYYCKTFLSVAVVDQCQRCGYLSNEAKDILRCPACESKKLFLEYPYEREVYEIDSTGCFYFDVRTDGILWIRTNEKKYIELVKHFSLPDYMLNIAGLPISTTGNLASAYTMARQARFEHGQNGQNGMCNKCLIINPMPS